MSNSLYRQVLNTPVALFIFNRPSLTRLCLQAIAAVRPKMLLIIGDAARSEDEELLVSQTRDLIKQLTWECDISVNFATNNMGCKLRVSTGLDWVFSQVEEAIILEDDCIADASFFHFCEIMLERYRYDKSVMHIGGVNFQFGKLVGDGGYYFSKYAHIWGWATFRRAWKWYDVEMSSWPNSGVKVLESVIRNDKELIYWKERLNGAFEGVIDTWDYQWQYAIWSKGGKCVVPQQNLVKNIGFGNGATHTVQPNPLFESMKAVALATTEHPENSKISELADERVFSTIFMPNFSGNNLSLLHRIVRKMKKIGLRTI